MKLLKFSSENIRQKNMKLSLILLFLQLWGCVEVSLSQNGKVIYYRFSVYLKSHVLPLWKGSQTLRRVTYTLHHRCLLTAGGKAQYECNCLNFTLLQLFEFTCIHTTLKYVYFCVNIHTYGSNIMQDKIVIIVDFTTCYGFFACFCFILGVFFEGGGALVILYLYLFFPFTINGN